MDKGTQNGLDALNARKEREFLAQQCFELACCGCKKKPAGGSIVFSRLHWELAGRDDDERVGRLQAPICAECAGGVAINPNFGALLLLICLKHGRRFDE